MYDSKSTQHLFRISLSLFFGSGLCALVYETVWVRQLTLSYGISVYAISTVLTAFMSGLCAGSYFCGRWSHRIGNPLRVYAYFELGIATYAFVLYFLLADIMPQVYIAGYNLLHGIPYAFNFARYFVTFFLLSIPTTLMGATLPLLCKYIQNKDNMVPYIGKLYGINTLGSVIGVGLAGFWMLKDLGIFATTVSTVLLNLAIALIAFWFSGKTLTTTVPKREFSHTPADESRKWLSRPYLVFLTLFLSGFTALSYELVWNRTLLLYIHNSTYAFSMILILFLLGIATGSLLFSRLPAKLINLQVMGLLQLALAFYVWFSFYLLRTMPSILSYLTEISGIDSWFAAMSTITVAVAAIVYLPTLLMGMTFPMGAILSNNNNDISTTTGKAYAYLTLGNILGSLITGFVLIEWIGLRNTFSICIAFNLFCGFTLLLHRYGLYRCLAIGAASTALVMGLFLVNVKKDVFRQYYQDSLQKIIFYK